MLERVIIDSRSAAGNRHEIESTSIENDASSLEETSSNETVEVNNSISEVDSQEQLEPELSWDLNLSPYSNGSGTDIQSQGMYDPWANSQLNNFTGTEMYPDNLGLQLWQPPFSNFGMEFGSQDRVAGSARQSSITFDYDSSHLLPVRQLSHYSGDSINLSLCPEPVSSVIASAPWMPERHLDPVEPIKVSENRLCCSALI
jgi:hypothetical protein